MRRANPQARDVSGPKLNKNAYIAMLALEDYGYTGSYSITSMHRTPEVNTAAGGVEDSLHLQGNALDIGKHPDDDKELAEWIKTDAGKKWMKDFNVYHEDEGDHHHFGFKDVEDTSSIANYDKYKKGYNLNKNEDDEFVAVDPENIDNTLSWATVGPAVVTITDGNVVDHDMGDGDLYTGVLKDGKPNGQGTKTWSNGDKYVGEFKEGERTGQGTFTSYLGSTHTGEFKNGEYYGQGTSTFPDGEKYVGEFKDGVRHGQGTYTSPDGWKYVGEWKDGKWNGQGTYASSNGEKYEGEFKDGEPNGQVSYTSPDGDKYVGEFKDGMYHGQGTYTWSNGRTYVGEYNQGRQTGGTLTAADGTVTENYIDADGDGVNDASTEEVVVEEEVVETEDAETEDIMGDLSLETIPSVQASTRVVDPSIQSQIDNGSLIDNGDGTYTRTNEDGSQEVLIQSLDAQGNSELIPRGEGEPVPEGSVVENIPPHPSTSLDVDGDGIPDVVDPVDNRVVTEVEDVIIPEVIDEAETEEVIIPEVIDGEEVIVPEKRTNLEIAGATAGALFEGAGSLLDAIGGPGAIISYIMGKKGLEAAMKEVTPHKMPELSPMFHQHLRQVKELAKQGFTANEERKIRKDIDGAYQIGLENAVRGTAGDRAKYLATSGILDVKRSNALLEFSAKDAELQRGNQDKYAEMMMFKENFDAQRSEQLRSEDMQMQLLNKQSAAQFTSAAFSNLMNIGGGNTALINKMMQQFAGTGNISISNELT